MELILAASEDVDARFFTVGSSRWVSLLPLSTYPGTGLHTSLGLSSIDLVVILCFYGTGPSALIGSVWTRICTGAGGIGTVLALLELHARGLSWAATDMR